MHTSICQGMVHQCHVDGCNVVGNASFLEKHNKEESVKHVNLLEARVIQLESALRNGVSVHTRLSGIRFLICSRVFNLNIYP